MVNVCTEGEASTKWCPHDRYSKHGASINAESVCGGSRCMMWRWHLVRVESFSGELKESDRGYCGLAGKPE